MAGSDAPEEGSVDGDADVDVDEEDEASGSERRGGIAAPRKAPATAAAAFEGGTESGDGACSEEGSYSGADFGSRELTGSLRITTTCLVCRRESHRSEAFVALSLPVDGSHASVPVPTPTPTLASYTVPAEATQLLCGGADPITVTTLLARSLGLPEALSGDNRYRCDGCGGLRDALRVALVDRLPPLLVLHLNRGHLHSVKVPLDLVECSCPTSTFGPEVNLL